MPTIFTYKDALRAIWDRSGYDRGFISNPFAGEDAAKLGLVRTQRTLEQAGFDRLPYGIVHVAGSKGKGSTSVMIDAILRAGGTRTGRYMSPQLHSFRERFVVDNQPISEGDFVGLTSMFVEAAERIEALTPEIGQVTAFELSTAMALGWFAMCQCDVAVVEVGLGGTFDSTNIVDPTVSVITTLDYEHTAILGDTIAEIAGNKAGIIKANRPVLSAMQPEEAMHVIERKAADKSASLAIADIDWHVSGPSDDFTYASTDHTLANLRTPLVGQHQVDNAGLAIAAVTTLATAMPSLQIDETAIREGIAEVRIPARFEQLVARTGANVVIDGAHTPASILALANAVQQRFPEASVAIMIGMLSDKNAAAILKPLQLLNPEWIVAAPKSPRAMEAGALSDEIRAIGGASVISEGVAEGLELALTRGVQLVLVTGSFTTAAEARIALGLAEFVDPAL